MCNSYLDDFKNNAVFVDLRKHIARITAQYFCIEFIEIIDQIQNYIEEHFFKIFPGFFENNNNIKPSIYLTNDC